MNISRYEVLANRLAWCNFLMKAHRKKGEHYLDKGHGVRCCLGHGCHVLDIPRIRRTTDLFYTYGTKSVSTVAPAELMEKVGLKDNCGKGVKVNKSPHLRRVLHQVQHDSLSLVALNDGTTLTPQQIGSYLLSVIHGGEDTPFISLDEYPEHTRELE